MSTLHFGNRSQTNSRGQAPFVRILRPQHGVATVSTLGGKKQTALRPLKDLKIENLLEGWEAFEDPGMDGGAPGAQSSIERVPTAVSQLSL